MNKLFRTLALLVSVTLVVTSCSKDPVRPEWPLSAEIFYSVKGRQVAFQALTHSAVSWEWDFGNGVKSNDKNPVYVYPEGGYYKAVLTATESSGAKVTQSVNLAIDLTPYAYLTGDPNAPGYAGKKWKLTSDHPSGGDYLADANAAFTTARGTPRPLGAGIFDLQFGMGDIYKDEYTFRADGSYSMDLKEDGAVFGGLLYQMVLSGGKDVINNRAASFGLCIAKYTPPANSTFTYTATENLTVASVYGAGGQLTYSNVSTLKFSTGAFVGFRDFQSTVILRSISDNKMQLVMFMSGSQQAIGVNTHALILSFDAVK